MAGFDDFTFPAPSTPWESPVASGSGTRPRGHSRHSSTSSIPPYVPVNTGRRGSTKDPEALLAALDRQKTRKRRTNSTASAVLPADEEEDEGEGEDDSTNVLRQRQEDARIIRCDAEQQRRNELGKGYDRLRSVLNRGDERLSKYRVVERATARVVQLRDQNERMEEELRRRQELIRDLNRANERLMLDASGVASSPHSASSPSSGRPGSSSHTSVSFVGQPGTHDRSSSLPTPPHTYTGLHHPSDAGEFGTLSSHYPSEQTPFAYNSAALEGDPQLYPTEFYAAAPHPLGVPRSESPHHLHPFIRSEDQAHWSTEWNATGSGLPGTFTDMSAPSAGFTTSSSAYGQP